VAQMVVLKSSQNVYGDAEKNESSQYSPNLAIILPKQPQEQESTLQ